MAKTISVLPSSPEEQFRFILSMHIGFYDITKNNYKQAFARFLIINALYKIYSEKTITLEHFEELAAENNNRGAVVYGTNMSEEDWLDSMETKMKSVYRTNLRMIETLEEKK